MLYSRCPVETGEICTLGKCTECLILFASCKFKSQQGQTSVARGLESKTVCALMVEGMAYTLSPVISATLANQD